jgi:NAD(P)H-flavin reductase
MNIKKLTGEIIKTTDLSKTSKEITIKLSEPIDFLSGSFMNTFIDVNGEKMRRAYSISSSMNDHDIITFSIRLSLSGIVTPIFWSKDIVGKKIDLMGPMGLNTVDKMNQSKVYLFAFGIGVSVIKSIADYFSNIKKVEHLTIYTGSRTEDEVLYKEYFDGLANSHENIKVNYVVSSPIEGSNIQKGYIQDFINDLDFNNSDVYVCGQDKACNALVDKINILKPVGCNLFIESFH